MPKRFHVVVGTDGTEEARAALAATLIFPWPARTTVTGVVARGTREAAGRPGYVRAALDRVYAQVATSARRALERRWPEARVDVLDEAPAEAILAEARRRRAGMIVLGTRARGWIARHLLGSVSAAVVRHAPCAVLVVRGRPRAFDRIVVGVDGSRYARRAVELVCRLPRPRAGAVTLVSAVEPTRLPSVPFMPAAGRAALAREAARVTLEAERRMRAVLRRHQQALRRAGWQARPVLLRGEPVQGLLSMAARARTRLLVIGARGAGGIERLLLGSVADGVLDRAPISVLIVR